MWLQVQYSFSARCLYAQVAASLGSFRSIFTSQALNCGEAFHTDSWLAEANPGHSDRDAILQALLPGPSMVVLFSPGKARML